MNINTFFFIIFIGSLNNVFSCYNLVQLIILILKTLISITRLITLRYDILCMCIYFIHNWFYKPFVISKCKKVFKYYSLNHHCGLAQLYFKCNDLS